MSSKINLDGSQDLCPLCGKCPCICYDTEGSQDPCPVCKRSPCTCNDPDNRSTSNGTCMTCGNPYSSCCCGTRKYIIGDSRDVCPTCCCYPCNCAFRKAEHDSNHPADSEGTCRTCGNPYSSCCCGTRSHTSSCKCPLHTRRPYHQGIAIEAQW